MIPNHTTLLSYLPTPLYTHPPIPLYTHPPIPLITQTTPIPASRLGNDGTLLEGVIDPLDRVVFHADQKARAQLGTRGTSIEQCGRGVRKPTVRQQVVGFNGSVNVILVDANRHTHQHLLGTLDDFAFYTQEVRSLQGLCSRGISSVCVLSVHSRLGTSKKDIPCSKVLP